MKRYIHTENAPEAIGPYSQAVLSDNTLYCSGQIPLIPQTGEMVEGDISKQTERVCDNIAAVLGAEGLCFDDVVKTTAYLVSMSDFPEFNEIYGKYFISKPARSTVAVKELPKGAKVEIEVIAIIPEDS